MSGIKEYEFWCDSETSNVILDDAALLEIAVIIRLDGKSLWELNRVIGLSKSQVATFSTWCLDTYERNGLLKEALESSVSIAQVEAEILTALDRFNATASESESVRFRLCGSSVQFDLRVLNKFMPMVAKRMHYQLYDVSSTLQDVRYVCASQRQFLRAPELPHRAYADIRASIQLRERLWNIIWMGEHQKARYR